MCCVVLCTSMQCNAVQCSSQYCTKVQCRPPPPGFCCYQSEPNPRPNSQNVPTHCTQCIAHTAHWTLHTERAAHTTHSAHCARCTAHSAPAHCTLYQLTCCTVDLFNKCLTSFCIGSFPLLHRRHRHRHHHRHRRHHRRRHRRRHRRHHSHHHHRRCQGDAGLETRSKTNVTFCQELCPP